MGFVEAIKYCFQHYIDFSGRAQRSQFWYWTLFTVIVSFVMGLIDGAIGIKIIGTVFSLATLLPGIGVTVRRLHDTDRSGWWILMPISALLIYAVFTGFTQASQEDSMSHVGDAIAGNIASLILALIFLGVVILYIVWLSKRGTIGPNRFGADPLGALPVVSPDSPAI